LSILQGTGITRLDQAECEPQPRHPLENRWCDRWGYFIDLAACEARADRRPFCRRCLKSWRQLCFPFFDKA